MSDSAIPWTIARQAPLSMKFSRQDYWSGLPFSSPRDLHHAGTELRSSALLADTLPSEPPVKLIILLEYLFHSQLNELTSYNYKTLRKQYKRNLKIPGTSLAVQGLRLCDLKARDTGSVPGQRNKILHVAQRKKN